MAHSKLEIVKVADAFPYEGDLMTDQSATRDQYVHFRVAANPIVTVGYILPIIAQDFADLPNWSVDSDASPRTLTLVGGHDNITRTAIMGQMTSKMRASGQYAVLKKWRDELLPIYGTNQQLLFSIERSAAPLFGIVTYGVHMTAYLRHANKGQEDSMKIWVPRRSSTRPKFPGMLDTSVGGALSSGETPWECLVRESEEEASLKLDIVESAKAVGTVTYFYLSGEGSGGEMGLCQPECAYVFDLDLTGWPSNILIPNDGSIEVFELMTVTEVMQALSRKEFKPNSALMMIDFLIRHGQITSDNEPDYDEICRRIHRTLEFPLM